MAFSQNTSNRHPATSSEHLLKNLPRDLAGSPISDRHLIAPKKRTGHIPGEKRQRFPQQITFKFEQASQHTRHTTTKQFADRVPQHPLYRPMGRAE